MTSRHTKRILLVGALDTKGEEVRFLKERLFAAGRHPEVVDIGVIGESPFIADVSRDEIARCAGGSIEMLRRNGDRGAAVAAMRRGLEAWVVKRHAASPVAGILAIGGSAGTSIATGAMQKLPVGVPKLMVSTMASGDTRPYVGITDISMMYSVADFSGLNRLTRAVLGNAAHAMAGMAEYSLPEQDVGDQRPLLGATMFGVTTPCVSRVKQRLEAAGYELLVFHATGMGGLAMEQLVHDGFIEGVLDITTTEWADEVVGGILSAGPHRLEAAAMKGIPQVISVGALDMVNFAAPETVPQNFRDRKFYPHNPNVTLMRTTPLENGKIGHIIAEKANASTGPVTIVLPLQGVSAIDADGKPFHDATADEALFDAIRSGVNDHVTLVETNLHINDPAFAERLVEEYLSICGGKHLDT